MNTMSKIVATAALSLLSATGCAFAASQGETVKPVFKHELPNVPGKSLIGVIVSYAPGGKSEAHHHAKSAFIYAQVLSGSIRSKIDGGEEKVYKAGENFYEDPGSHHSVSQNASKSKSASLLAVFIVDTADAALTTPDK